LIPWFPAWRQGVPSKLYEYVAFGRPVLIAGPDSGGVSSLLNEWGHPQVVADRAEFVAEAIRRAERGDTLRLFDPSRCSRAPQSEHDFGERYASLAATTVSASRSSAVSHAVVLAAGRVHPGQE
jgi:hypothetical protein